MSHTMKLWERIIEQHLRGVTNITENQFGFMPERSTMEAIFFDKATYGEMLGVKEKHAYDFYLPGEAITKCLEMSCGVLCRSTKSHQSTLPSLRICTIML
jgi:hypothetical protein